MAMTVPRDLLQNDISPDSDSTLAGLWMANKLAYRRYVVAMICVVDYASRMRTL